MLGSTAAVLPLASRAAGRYLVDLGIHPGDLDRSVPVAADQVG